MGTGGRAAGRSPAEEEQVEATGHASPGQELVAAAGCASWEKGGYGISPCFAVMAVYSQELW